MVRINLNDPIKVKLTDYGRDIFYHRYDPVNKLYKGELSKPKLPEEDADGYSTFTLHDFMQLYGLYLAWGNESVIQPFEIIYEAGANEQ